MDLKEMGEAACRAKTELLGLSSEDKNRALLKIADALIENTSEILKANQIDINNGKKKNMPEGLLDRLALSDNRIQAMATGLRQVANLPDPIGEIIDEFDRPNGMHISKIRVPFGVIGIIFESRPNVTSDAFGLCFKTGNAVILKGGSDALYSNIAITGVIRDTLEKENITPNAISLIDSTDRAVTAEFMRMKEYVDLLIPRGGANLIRTVVENSTIPVIETGTGNCHVYVDKTADIDMAVNIIENAKTQRIGVCNAMESLIVHRDVCKALLESLMRREKMQQVEMRADEFSSRFLDSFTPVSEKDFGTEYLAYILSVKTVDSLEEAIDHINRYSTHHSETIVTKDRANAEKFQKEIDSACVYWNVSTRFTDGFEFGFGAEIGISTQKLHARGPMGLKELTSYKYIISGNGQIRG